MAHAQKPDFVFRRKGRVHLNRRGTSVQSTTVSRGVRISSSNAGYTMFRGSVKSTGYPLHSPVSPSLTLPCVTVCRHISTGLYDKYDVNSNSGEVYTFIQKENNSFHISRRNVERDFKTFPCLHNANVLSALMKYEIKTNITWNLSAHLTGNGLQFQQKVYFFMAQYPAFENHIKQQRFL
jgi:hypothetical protein